MFIYGIHDACIFRSLRAHCTVAHNCRAACIKSSEYTAFAVLLVAVAGKKGFLAIFSFLITVLTIWKILVPAYSKGYSPVWTGIAITVFLTFIIIFFVYGFISDQRCGNAGFGISFVQWISAS